MANILIVDDSPVERRVASALLSGEPEWHIVESGSADGALLSLDLCPMDLLLTDLQMPGVGGFDLLERVKDRHPDVAVLVLTGCGNEETAVRALEIGADGYIPKRRLRDDLLPAVKRTLALARTYREQARVRRYITETRVELQLENDLAHVTPVVKRLVEQCREFGLAGFHEQMRLSVAIEEALTNAIIHGNLEVSSELREHANGAYEQLIDERRTLERFAERRVYVTCQTNRIEARIVIRDEGPGFDVARLPDPRAREQLDRASGRGVLLMRAFLDAVEYNAAGNQVTLVKRCGAAVPGTREQRLLPAACGA